MPSLLLDINVDTGQNDVPTGFPCPASGLALCFGNPAADDAWTRYTSNAPSGYEWVPVGFGATDYVSNAAIATGISSASIFGAGGGFQDSGAYGRYDNAAFAQRSANFMAVPPAGGIVSFNPDGVSYDVAPPLGGEVAGDVNSILFGDLVETYFGTVALNATIGAQAVTGVGFQPDLVLFLGCHPGTYVGRDGTLFTLGAADANGNQWVLAGKSVFGSTCIYTGGILNYVSRSCRFHDAACIASIGGPEFVGGGFTVDQLAELTSMDADGFTLNLLAAGLSGDPAQSVVAFVALRMLGSSRAAVGVGTQGETGIVTAFAPEAMLFASAQTTDNDTDIDFVNLMIGGMDDVNQRSSWIGSATSINCNDWGGGRLAPECRAYRSTSKAIRFSRYDEVLLAEAAATLTGTGCSLDWTTDDSVARKFGWVALKIACTGAVHELHLAPFNATPMGNVGVTT